LVVDEYCGMIIVSDEFFDCAKLTNPSKFNSLPNITDTTKTINNIKNNINGDILKDIIYKSIKYTRKIYGKIIKN
jgi:hypothetical protein